MEELKRDVKAVKAAIWGDPEDPQKTPGLRAEMHAMRYEMRADVAQVKAEITSATSTLRELREDARRVVWLFIAAIITAVIGLVLKN